MRLWPSIQKGNGDVESPAALTFALVGEAAKARKLIEQINKESPLDTMVQTYTLPSIRASIELTSNHAHEAIDCLKIAEAHELGATNVPPSAVYPAYVRGLAYLKLGQGTQAAAEFRKVVDNPGVVRLHLQGALAHLQLGRAQAMAGDKAAARKSYQDFLTLWKTPIPTSPSISKPSGVRPVAIALATHVIRVTGMRNICAAESFGIVRAPKVSTPIFAAENR